MSISKESQVVFWKELIVIPFIWKNNKGQIAWGEIREMAYPPLYEVLVEDKPIMYLRTLEEAKQFVQNHFHKYVKETYENS